MSDLFEVFELEISQDVLQAKLKQKAPAPENLTYEELNAFLQQSGVSAGLKHDVIAAVISGDVLPPVVIAEGKAPKAGKDAFLWTVLDEQAASDIRNEELETKSRVNLREVIDIPTVRSGEVVGKKIHPTAGTDGTGVNGEVLPGKNGKDLTLRPGKNTRINDDADEITSAIDGQISVEPRLVHVYPVYEVNGDLDLKTGNLDFIGNINIRGNVPAGFSVKAQGDIRVHGSVEAARLTAGGSIYIHQGIVAQGDGAIEAEGEVRTSFINQANVFAAGDITVSTSILHSHIEAHGAIICNERKGNVCGGKLAAVKGVDVNEIGNQMNTPTEIYIGVSKRLLEREEHLRQQKARANDELNKNGKLLKKIIDKEKHQPLSDKERTTKKRIRRSFSNTYEQLNEAAGALDAVQRSLQLNEQAKIAIRRQVFPMTDLYFGKYRRRITSTHQGVIFYLHQSEITFEPV
ncbi:DUF342 domain-containing protein [Salisediminibacterium halotolerans]|uniref:Flagellar Assembly Protein A N-terminal region domain-containing protein n=1 Tax=Salisediminibacterium halotolerans TaxID=517425 RepID=A0A1H9Q719_9BACI|nr:FapA family protein [Salisediminibacterium haloalkalitolerans]SER56222.1 hypothetical protein SAMN05444126_102157 [Salisediminibacterium haloalkalitolerans]